MERGETLQKYNTLLFDLDDTLLDFDAAEKSALRQLCASYSLSLTPEMEKRYQTINKSLWEAYEEGKIDRDEVLNTRFSRFFAEYGETVDGIELEKRFRRFLQEGHELIDDAFDIISSLKNDYQLFIVTNGVADTQAKRLNDSGLRPFFDDVFVSDEIGYQKPKKEFFQYVFEKIPQVHLDATLIIGDSLTSDIKGGHLVGIDSCWFNPKLKENYTKISPTYEIQKLKDLYRILNF